MVVVFVIAALLAFAASQLLPRLASGLGIDAMLIYLLLAVITAIFKLFKMSLG